MDITTIHQAISDAVNTAQLKPGSLQVTATPYMPLYPTVPHFCPFSWRASYDKTYGGLVELTTTWHLVLSLSNDEAGHQEATKLAGSGESTIRSVLIDARGGPGEDALGGACDDILLRSSSGPNLVDIGDTHLLVIEFSIYVTGD